MRFRLARLILALSLIILAVAFISSRFLSSYQDIPALFREAHKKPLWFLLFLEAFYLLLNGLLSQRLLRIAGSRVSLKETVKVGALGILGFQIAPFIGGAFLVYFFYKKLRVPSSTILFLVTILLLFNWMNSLFFSFLAVLFLPQSFFSLVPERAILTLLFALLFILILGYFLLKNRAKNLVAILGFAVQPVNRVSRFLIKKDALGEDQAKRIVEELLRDGDLILWHRNLALQAFFFSLFSYAVNLSTLYFSFFVFGYHPPVSLLVIGLTASSLISLLSFFPEAPGVMEASLVTSLIWLGLPAHVSLFAALLYRFVSYWLLLPFGLAVYLHLNGHSPRDLKTLFDDGEEGN